MSALKLSAKALRNVGMSAEDIAKAINVSVDTVEGLLT